MNKCQFCLTPGQSDKSGCPYCGNKAHPYPTAKLKLVKPFCEHKDIYNWRCLDCHKEFDFSDNLNINIVDWE